MGMLRRSSLIALCIAAACGREAVKQLIDETRAPTRIIVEIRLEQTALPNDKEIRLRHSFGEAIENEHIGIVARSTSDVGRMDLAVDVKDSVSAIPRIHEVLMRFHVDERSTVRIDDTH